jgi:hypothetical protein
MDHPPSTLHQSVLVIIREDRPKRFPSNTPPPKVEGHLPKDWLHKLRKAKEDSKKNKEGSRRIRQSTPMILMLCVRPSRGADLITSDRMQFRSTVSANKYRDGFGNTYHVIHVPAGGITISSDVLVSDSGAPEDIGPAERQTARFT